VAAINVVGQLTAMLRSLRYQTDLGAGNQGIRWNLIFGGKDAFSLSASNCHDFQIHIRVLEVNPDNLRNQFPWQLVLASCILHLRHCHFHPTKKKFKIFVITLILINAPDIRKQISCQSHCHKEKEKRRILQVKIEIYIETYCIDFNFYLM